MYEQFYKNIEGQIWSEMSLKRKTLSMYEHGNFPKEA